MQEILTIEEAAKLLRLNPQVVGRKLRSGELPGRQIGTVWRLSRKALESFFTPNQSNILNSKIISATNSETNQPKEAGK